MKHPKSAGLFSRAKAVIPGGVNSPVRAFKSVGRDPVFIREAKGATITDVDGNEYIDYVGSWGPMILGHAHPEVIEAVERAARSGTSFGAPTELEVKIAELICRMLPSIEMVRMVNSGTEATMSAIRLARAFAGREKIIKFEGCYHGHSDSFLIKAGSGALTLGVPDSPGVPASLAAATLNARFNNIDSVNRLIEQNKNQIAAIIVEPVVGNMGCVPPYHGFLAQLREVSSRHNIVLIFDEVMTGFRVAAGGAQALYGVSPDLTTLGKIIGGGLPVGAYGGKKELMEMVAPIGPMYQAGTLSGNPLAMAAGYTTLRLLNENKEIYDHLEHMAAILDGGIAKNLTDAGLTCIQQRVGSMGTLFFADTPVRDFQSALNSDVKKYAAYFNAMLDHGVYLAPSQFEAGFISAAHTEGNIKQTIAANKTALEQVVKLSA